MLQCDLTIIIEVVTHMAEHRELLVTVRNKVALLASLLDSALDHCFGDHDWFPLADEHSIAYRERASALSGRSAECPLDHLVKGLLTTVLPQVVKTHGEGSSSL